MKIENTSRHNAIPCPCCGYKTDAATPISEENGNNAGPEAGSIALCLKCGQILEYADASGQLTLAVCPRRCIEGTKETPAGGLCPA